MVQVMVALGLLGIVVVIFSSVVGNTFAAQRIARLQGEKQDLRAVFRGAFTCETRCSDLLSDVPRSVGRWAVSPTCEKGVLKIKVGHPELYKGALTPLYAEGQERAACRKVAQMPRVKSQEGKTRRVYCNPGQKVAGVNFLDQSVSCQ